MSQLVSLLGAEHSSTESSLNEVFDFEKKLAQVGRYTLSIDFVVFLFFHKSQKKFKLKKLKAQHQQLVFCSSVFRYLHQVIYLICFNLSSLSQWEI